MEDWNKNTKEEAIIIKNKPKQNQTSQIPKSASEKYTKNPAHILWWYTEVSLNQALWVSRTVHKICNPLHEAKELCPPYTILIIFSRSKKNATGWK